MFSKQDIPTLKQPLNLACTLGEHQFNLSTKYGVFSPKSIDEGTILLLKYLDISADDIVFDLGCGYGPIGLYAGKTAKEVHMVDKDFIAVELSNINAQKHGLTHCTAYLSDAFSAVPEGVKFTQVISNIPAKVGREQLSIILHDAYDHMKVGASITFVSINGLREFLKTNFKAVFGNYTKVKQGAKYTISRAVKE